MTSERWERAAALVVRAWVEAGRDASEGLRARITYTTDLRGAGETVVVATTPAEVTAIVADWLERFVAG